MDLNRLAIDLSAAIEEARRLAQRAGAGYIKPKHLFLVLLGEGGALRKLATPLGLDAGMAAGFVQDISDVGNDGSLEPGMQPIASRALRDLLDRSYAVADKRGGHIVGVLEVGIAAVEGGGPLGRAMQDAGWTVEKL